MNEVELDEDDIGLQMVFCQATSATGATCPPLVYPTYKQTYVAGADMGR